MCLLNYYRYILFNWHKIRPDGHSPNTSDQAKWPLRPGVLVHVNKMNNVSISQLRTSPFKSTSVKTSTYLKYRQNKSKIYARLERLKDLLGFKDDHTHVPMGISEGAGGGKRLLSIVVYSCFIPFFVCFCMVVVTFKKFHSSPQSRQDATNCRKRKKPGDGECVSFVEFFRINWHRRYL